MAGSSRAALRRRQEAEQARRDRLILLGTLVVLGITAVIVLVGVFFTVYRPPREVVLTIDDDRITAADAENRATFYMVAERGAFSRQVEGVATFILDRLVSEAMLRREAPALVGEVDDAAIDAKAHELLGTQDETRYAELLKDTLQKADTALAEYREILRLQILADRLREQFKAELPASGHQLHVLRVRAPSLVNAERVVERATAGESFADLAPQYTADRRLPVDLSWQPLDLLSPEQLAAIEGLPAGGVSAPVTAGLFFDVFQIAEIDPNREYSEEQKNQLAQKRVEAWVKEHEEHSSVERSLSPATTEWIESRVGEHVNRAFRQ